MRPSAPGGDVQDAVEGAVALRRPLALVITDDRLSHQVQLRRHQYAAELEKAGCTVLQWSWSEASAGQLLREVDAALSSAAGRVVAAVSDVELADPADALPITEAAWHAGCTTVVRWPGAGVRRQTESDPALRPAQRRDAVDHADVLVSSPEGVDILEQDGSPVLARVVAGFGAADVMAMIGPLAAPEADLTLTVLVTTYDRPHELATCLESLTRQTLAADRFDVVVVDDASPRDVTPIVARFSERLRISLIRQSVNSGPGAARSAGTTAATGDVVLLLDDDDVAGPRVLAEHLRLHQAEPGPGVVVLGHTVVRPSGRPDVLSRHVTRTGHQYFAYGLMRAGDEFGWQAVWAGRSSAKRRLLAQHLFRNMFMEDTDFGFRADQALRAEGAALRVIYAREAVQVMQSPLSLAGMRRRQMKMGMAAWAFRRSIGEDLSPQRGEAHQAIAAHSLIPARVLDQLGARASESLVALRAGSNGAAANSRLATLDGVLATDLTAHHGLGLLIAEKHAQLRRSGVMPVVGVDGGDTASAAAAAAAVRAGDPVRLVVRVEAGETGTTAFIASLAEAMRATGRGLDDVGDVEVRPTDVPLSAMSDVHFTLTTAGIAVASPGAPLPLTALAVGEWLSWFAASGRGAGSLH